jgi:hypothetical protein
MHPLGHEMHPIPLISFVKSLSNPQRLKSDKGRKREFLF